MEGKSTFESKVFRIPIEEFEKDIDKDLTKARKKEILDLFANSNKIHSEEEFLEIEYILREACINGDINLIKICLSETIENGSQDLKFKIDKTNRTASLFKVNNENIEEIYIPKAIKYESIDYLITSVIGIENDKIKAIKFAEDSEVKTIYRCAFSRYVEEVNFHSSLKELKEGWCHEANKLKKIIISSSNDQFIFKDEKYLIGKSDSTSSEFDKLLFARRDIEEISIPSNIKIISSYAFYKCKNLRNVEISPNSNLQTIESYAFSDSNIKEIFIPPKVSEIGENAFSFSLLTKVEIPLNSNLQRIGPCAFSYTKIKEIFIPPKVSEICENTFYGCINLTKVEISPNSNLQTIRYYAFSSSNIEEISIPLKVSSICENAFYKCTNLRKVEILTNSNLQTIEFCAFSDTKIKEFFIPSKVSIIYERTFFGCQYLSKIEIPSNSNLQTIENEAFSLSNIEKIYFPSSLRELKCGWCYCMKNLTKIIISPSNDQFIFKDDKYLLGKSDSKSDEFDIILFARRDIEEISIPSNISKIREGAFDLCKNLTKVEFSQNSNLQAIGNYAFSNSNIKAIFIPPKVLQLGQCSFNCCKNLTKIEIPPNSNLQTIEPFAFQYSDIKGIFIPSNVTKICKYAFHNCQNLQIVEISEESKLELIPLSDFYDKNTIIMIPSSLNYSSVVAKKIESLKSILRSYISERK